MQRLIERVGFFLNLVGITALLVGGVGIGNAVAGYVASKTEAIATLKCLGASTRLVFAAYLLQILALALVGIAGGVLLGGDRSGRWSRRCCKGLLPAAVPLGALSGAAGAGRAVRAVDDGCSSRCGRSPRSAGCRPARCCATGSAPAPRRLLPLAAAASAAAALALAALVVATRAGPARRAVVSRRHRWPPSLVFRLAGWLIVAAARLAPRPSRPVLRLALANLHRPGAPTARVVLSLGLGLSVMVAVALVAGQSGDRDRRAGWPSARRPISSSTSSPTSSPASPRSCARCRAPASTRCRCCAAASPGSTACRSNRRTVAPEAQWALRSDRGLTYAATPPHGLADRRRQLVAGRLPRPAAGLVRRRAGAGHGAQGRRHADRQPARPRDHREIANLRQIDWSRLGINFAIVFAPGTLEAAPQTHLAAVYAAPAEAEALVRQVTDRFPNVSAIPVREALAAVARVVATIGGALRLVALVTLAAGILVLGGAVAAGHRRRVYDAVVLKVLGATRGTIAAAFLVEHVLLGLVDGAGRGGARHARRLGPRHRGDAQRLGVPAGAAAADRGRGRAADDGARLRRHLAGARRRPAPYLRDE